MGLFDDLPDDDKRKAADDGKKDRTSFFSLFDDVDTSNPIKPARRRTHKDLEAYSDDKEAAEDGFFDEDIL